MWDGALCSTHYAAGWENVGLAQQFYHLPVGKAADSRCMDATKTPYTLFDHEPEEEQRQEGKRKTGKQPS